MYTKYHIILITLFTLFTLYCNVSQARVMWTERLGNIIELEDAEKTVHAQKSGFSIRKNNLFYYYGPFCSRSELDKNCNDIVWKKTNITNITDVTTLDKSDWGSSAVLAKDINNNIYYIGEIYKNNEAVTDIDGFGYLISSSKTPILLSNHLFLETKRFFNFVEKKNKPTNYKILMIILMFSILLIITSLLFKIKNKKYREF